MCNFQMKCAQALHNFGKRALRLPNRRFNISAQTWGLMGLANCKLNFNQNKIELEF